MSGLNAVLTEEVRRLGERHGLTLLRERGKGRSGG